MSIVLGYPHSMQPPVADRRELRRTHHGQVRVDDYEWLREKDDPEVTAYLEAENAYTEERTAHLADLRQAIFDEIKARTLETDLSVPLRNRGHWYYGRSFEGQEYGASCRVPVADDRRLAPPRPAEDCRPDQPALPDEEVLLDLDELAEGHEFFSLGGSSVSPDGAAAGLRRRRPSATSATRCGSRTSAPVSCSPTSSPSVMGGVTWSRDGRDALLRHRRRGLASRQDLAAPARHRAGRRRAGLPRDRRPLLGRRRPHPHRPVPASWRPAPRPPPSTASSTPTTPQRGLAGLRPAPRGPRVLPRARRHRRRGRASWCMHNATGPDFEIGVAPIAPTDAGGLAPADPPRPRRPARGRRRVRRPPGGPPAQRGPDPAAHPRARRRRRRRRLPRRVRPRGLHRRLRRQPRASTSPSCGWATPPWPCRRRSTTTTCRSRELTLLRRSPVLGGYDPDDYEEHRLWATARRRRAGADLAGRAAAAPATTAPIPFLLYGYGAYEASIDPYFSVARLSLLDRGRRLRDRPRARRRRDGPPVVRRGQARATSSNTFDDFVACARHLVDDRLDDRRSRSSARARSAGGLLIGAVANQAPEPSPALVAGVPFVDTLTTMLDASLPLTVTEYDEWGNPGGRPGGLRLTSPAYAPYDNVDAQSTTRRSWPRPRSTTPACSTSSRPSGWPGCARPRWAAATSCCAPRCRPGTAGSRVATRPGTTGPSRWPGCWTGWASPTA